jgi:hypothetical protein
MAPQRPYSVISGINRKHGPLQVPMWQRWLGAKADRTILTWPPTLIPREAAKEVLRLPIHHLPPAPRRRRFPNLLQRHRLMVRRAVAAVSSRTHHQQRSLAEASSVNGGVATLGCYLDTKPIDSADRDDTGEFSIYYPEVDSSPNFFHLHSPMISQHSTRCPTRSSDSSFPCSRTHFVSHRISSSIFKCIVK